jgi:lambda family phage portal protein
VAYWFWRVHPGDSTFLSGQAERVRVPAENVLHLYSVERPGQIRGWPRTVRALTDLYMLDLYDEAELDRKKTAALLAGFIIRPDNEEPALVGEGDPDADGIATANWQPGTMQVLLPGEDVKFSEPADVGSSYELFQYRTLLQVSAALGIPYANLTNDMLKANYSNTRAALVEFRRRTGALQNNVLIHQFCRPVWRRFVEQAVLSGVLEGDAVALSEKVKWIVPKWEWVDPLKDRQAEKLAVECGFKSRSDVVEAEGYDPEEMDKRIAADKEREEELGLSFAPGASAPAEEDEDTPDDQTQAPEQFLPNRPRRIAP